MTTLMPGGGPRVVALGGGHGLSATLAAARHYAGSLTAVVSVADDGGSTGRIRLATAGLAPGDLRRCLTVLGDPALPLTGALEHRFREGDLTGHAVGNLLLAGLADAFGGDLVAACDEVARLTGSIGRVLPASAIPVELVADASDGVVVGQTRIAKLGPGVRRVRVSPPDACPPTDVLKAIAEAEQIVLGPGSLLTSVIASLVVPGIVDALVASSGRLVFVANLTQEGEGGSGSLRDQLRRLADHGVTPDVTLADLRHEDQDLTPILGKPLPVVYRRLANPDAAVHDPLVLAEALRGLC